MQGEESVKRFGRSNGLDTALYKIIPLPLFIKPIVGTAVLGICKLLEQQYWVVPFFSSFHPAC